MNELREWRGKRMKKKYIVIPAAALALLGIGTGAVFAND